MSVPSPAEQRSAGAVLQPLNVKAANFNPGRIKPALPFAQAKGRLPLPAQGRRIIGFGERAHTNRSSGIVIETRAGGQVISPMDGWVVFAGVFRSYGQILIINGGDGYHMLLAGLSQIDVQLGQFVLAGEPVGLMSGAPRGGDAKPPANAPVLYVELRKDGRSIDPDPWWASEGTQKVQG
jgi:septal ring factor EnvC (AmiA/AmiB activator)